MKIKVLRDKLTDKSTTGKLFINNSFWCYTLEDKTRDKKVYGETCIPTGTYEIDMYYWSKYKRYYPHLRNVPNYSGVLIHKGSTPEDTMGCILVGMDRGKDLISNCAQAYDPLKGLIEEALGEGVTIEVALAEDASDERTSTT